MGKQQLIDDVILTSLKIIEHPAGNILHNMKRSDAGFINFGESYFSIVNKGDIKGWKKHLRMILNLVVPVGEVEFVLFDSREKSNTKGLYNSFILSQTNYCRLTVPNNVWFAFRGLSTELNLINNIASIEHDPNEIERKELYEIKYPWK